MFSLSSLILMPSHDSLLLFCVFSASVAPSLFVFLPCSLHISLSSWETSRTPPAHVLSAHPPSELEASSVSAWRCGGEEVSRTPLWKCSFNVWRMLRGLCGWLSFQSVRSCAVGAPPSIRLWGVKWGVRPRRSVRLALKQHWTPTELMHMQNCISYCARVTKRHTLKRQEKHAKEQRWAIVVHSIQHVFGLWTEAAPCEERFSPPFSSVFPVYSGSDIKAPP